LRIHAAPPALRHSQVWGASSEVKNKAPLLDSRKVIERRMETFKVVERETKMKAFSKEGLARDVPMSAEEKRRLKTREWVQDVVNKLSDGVSGVWCGPWAASRWRVGRRAARASLYTHATPASALGLNRPPIPYVLYAPRRPSPSSSPTPPSSTD
jgi:hypothetical protein